MSLTQPFCYFDNALGSPSNKYCDILTIPQGSCTPPVRICLDSLQKRNVIELLNLKHNDKLPNSLKMGSKVNILILTGEFGVSEIH